MIGRLIIAMSIFLATDAMATAGGCPPSGGTEIAEVEEMNQMFLDSDFGSLSMKIGSYFNSNMPGIFDGIAALFKDGFTSCTTIAQRRDIGGMTQQVVEFKSTKAPMFAYWLSTTNDGAFQLLRFNYNTDPAIVLGELR